MIGWIGVSLLLLAYVLLVFKKTSGWFLPVDLVASLILTVHAGLIHDIPFVLVNAFVACMLSVKLFQRTGAPK